MEINEFAWNISTLYLVLDAQNYRVESKAQELIKLFKLQFKQSIIIIANFHIEIINLMEKLNTNFTPQILYAECTYFFHINSVAFLAVQCVAKLV